MTGNCAEGVDLMAMNTSSAIWSALEVFCVAPVGQQSRLWHIGLFFFSVPWPAFYGIL
jgi:hypothetical protein